MMNKIVVTPQELMYLAVNVGADEFFGIADPFMGMTLEEIHASLEDVKLSLDKKGYVRMSFDGDIQVDGEVEKLVKICAFCNGCISVDKFRNGERAQLLVYITHDDFVVLLPSDNSLCLFAIDIRQAREQLAEAVGEIPDKTAFASVRLHYTQWRELRTMLADGSMNAPSKGAEHCDETLCAILADGFSGKSDYVMLLAVGFGGHHTGSMILLHTASGSACAVQEDDGEWLINPPTRKIVTEWIDCSIGEYQREVE